jgi:proteic killer suppression protein
VDIIFKTSKLEKECNDSRLSRKKHGTERADRLRRRLDELRAANNLEEIRSLPQARAHELIGDRAGQISLDLDHPYRLIIEPAHDPIPAKEDGGLDWQKVTAVRVLEIADTH